MQPKNSFSRWLIPVFGLLIVFWITTPASYALATDNFLDQMIRLYATQTTGWEGVLQGYALRLFWLLAGIEFSWTAIKLALRGADLSEFLAELLNRVLYIGFFLTLLLHSAEWSHDIVNSFRLAGSAASTAVGGTGGIAPSNVLDTGMQILKKITSSMSIFDPGDSVILALAAITILIGFAFITALLILALVESYFIISAGVIMMGFGGSRWTNEFAINTIRYAVSVGAKLFMAQLVIGLGQQILNTWAAQATTGNFDLDDVLMIAASTIVFVVITKIIPDMVQGLINGSSVAHGGHLTTAATEAAGVAGAAAVVTAGLATGSIGTVGGVLSAKDGAMKLASEQLKESGYSSNSNWSPGAVKTGLVAKEITSHLAQNIGQRFRGEIRGGNIGAQIGNEMIQKAERMKELREGKEEAAATAESNNGNGSNRIYSSQDSQD